MMVAMWRVLKRSQPQLMLSEAHPEAAEGAGRWNGPRRWAVACCPLSAEWLQGATGRGTRGVGFEEGRQGSEPSSGHAILSCTQPQG